MDAQGQASQETPGGVGPAGDTADPAPRKVAKACLSVFAVVWIITAIEPSHPRDWLLENVLTFLCVPYLLWIQRDLPFKPGTNLALLAFLCLHSVGAHFTYAEVPYEQWSRQVFGFSPGEFFGWRRNHFDRLVHLLYGALVLPATRELFGRSIKASPFALELISIQFIVATSALYELIEWGATLVVDQELGMAYLGIQGDIWDAHKDMLLAAVGAVASAAVSGPLSALRCLRSDR
jgi:putative membrane protein